MILNSAKVRAFIDKKDIWPEWSSYIILTTNIACQEVVQYTDFAKSKSGALYSYNMVKMLSVH